MHVFPKIGPIYENARADDCETLTKHRGVRIVRYRGRVYAVTGYYLASNGGERVVCYVLRWPWMIDGGTEKVQRRYPSRAPIIT